MREVAVFAKFLPELKLVPLPVLNSSTRDGFYFPKFPPEATLLQAQGFILAALLRYKIESVSETETHYVTALRLDSLAVFKTVPDNMEEAVRIAVKKLGDEQVPKMFGWLSMQ